MAASFIRCVKFVAQKQIRSTIRLWQRNDPRRIMESPRSLRLFRLITSSTVGSGAGATCAFLGFGWKKEEQDEEEVDILTKTYRLARLAHHRQDFEKADELYHEALKLADDLLKKEEITKEKALTARTLMFDGLADIALKSGQIETARNLFIETMKGCLQQGLETDHNAIIEMSLKLSSICAMMGQKEEAEEGFKFCVQAQSAKMQAKEEEWSKKAAKEGKILYKQADTLEEKEQDTAVLLGMALGSYGRYLLHEKRFAEALPYFERARVIALHTLGTNTNQYVVMLNDLATLHIVSRSYDKAEELLKTGITISEREKLQEGAMLYCNLGAVHIRRGVTKDATKACHKASELAKQFDHKMAFKMADNCLKKCASIDKEKAKSLDKDKEKAKASS